MSQNRPLVSGSPDQKMGPASQRLGRLVRLARKELSESLRDRRTVVTLVLMPLLLYPLLTVAFQQVLLSRRVETLQPVYRVGFVSAAEADALEAFWQSGRPHLFRRHAPAAAGQAVPAPAHLDPVPRLERFVADDLDRAVRDGTIDVGVRLRPAGPFRADPRRLLHVDCDLSYREGSDRGRAAARYLELLTSEANVVLISRGLAAMRVPQRGDPVQAHATVLPAAPDKRSPLTPVLIPLVLVLMTMTGAVYPAIDLTAGERERGTLEILVAAPIGRLSVLLAKYVAVFTVAVLTALVNLGAMILTLRVTGVEETLFGSALGVVVLLQVLGLLLLFAAFFSAVLLALTSFARSFKEAQATIIPLMLVCLGPGVLALLPGLSLAGPLAVLPLLNVVLLARDLLEGTASVGVAGVVVASTLIYSAAAVALAARVFGAEAVLSSESSGWGDVFRRPRESRPTPEPSSALLCLALLFPAYFLLSSGLARVQGVGVPGRLGLTAGVSVLLFVGFPLAALWRGRVLVRGGLRLVAPAWQACAVALLLGACLWPFAHEIILLVRRAGLATLRPEQVEHMREFLAGCRRYSPVWVVAALALAPAVAEELFFRGYLLAALLGAGAGRAVVATAVLFAAFHLLVTDALAVERLPASLLLGLVLGWLSYASGSVAPGMLLHALHNGLLVLMAYYEPQLAGLGWAPSAEAHLPAWLLGAAAVGVAVGLAGLSRLRPPG
jgi:ABC-2 type transport system permease protein/sodium transport system permease protein